MKAFTAPATAFFIGVTEFKACGKHRVFPIHHCTEEKQQRFAINKNLYAFVFNKLVTIGWPHS